MSLLAGFVQGAAKGIQSEWDANREVAINKAKEVFQERVAEKKATALITAAKTRATFETDAAGILSQSRLDEMEDYVREDGQIERVKKGSQTVREGLTKMSYLTSGKTLHAQELKTLQSLFSNLRAADADDPYDPMHQQYLDVFNALKRSLPSMNPDVKPPSTLPPASQANKGKAVNVNGNIFESNGSVWTLVVK